MTRASKAEDVEIGRLLKLARKRVKYSQAELGRAVGITYQQVQKYESGVDRLSTSRLLQMARVMEIDPTELLPLHEGEGIAVALDDDALKLLADFKRIDDPAARRAAQQAVQAIAAAFAASREEAASSEPGATPPKSGRRGKSS